MTTDNDRELWDCWVGPDQGPREFLRLGAYDLAASYLAESYPDESIEARHRAAASMERTITAAIPDQEWVQGEEDTASRLSALIEAAELAVPYVEDAEEIEPTGSGDRANIRYVLDVLRSAIKRARGDA